MAAPLYFIAQLVWSTLVLRLGLELVTRPSNPKRGRIRSVDLPRLVLLVAAFSAVGWLITHTLFLGPIWMLTLVAVYAAGWFWLFGEYFGLGLLGAISLYGIHLFAKLALWIILRLLPFDGATGFALL